MSGRDSDGRKMAVELLKSIDHLNNVYLQDVRKSRDLMVAALEKFSDLPAKPDRDHLHAHGDQGSEKG